MGESIVYGIKIALAVTLTMVFASAVISILAMMTSFISSSIIGEIFGLMSVFLPFDAGLFFGGINVAFTAIISFVVARKIWTLSGATYKMT